MTTSSTNLLHERYCLARPGESEVRLESYSATKYGEDGVTAVGAARIDRCIECGAMTRRRATRRMTTVPASKSRPAAGAMVRDGSRTMGGECGPFPHPDPSSAGHGPQPRTTQPERNTDDQHPG